MLGGVHIEAPPAGRIDHRRPKPLSFGGQPVSQTGQNLHIHPNAHVLHAGQHPHQGYLHVVVQVPQPLGLQRGQQGGGQMSHGQSLETSLHRGIRCVTSLVAE